MRWAFVLGGLAVVGAVVALVVAVVGTHDEVPGRLKDCLRDAGVTLARGPEAVGPLRRDVAAGRDLRPRTRRVGEDDVVLVTQPDYALVVLRTPDNPPLDGEALRKVAEDPSQFSVVGLVGRDLDDVPADCVARLAAEE